MGWGNLSNFINQLRSFEMELVSNNVNQLFEDGLWRFKISGVKDDSRNGPVYVMPEPVLTRIKSPRERVLFYERRDANPIFHLMESIWILAGRRDVEFLKQFNSNIDKYSDDGKIFNAPYGYRMRKQFEIDQLNSIVDILKLEPNSRQAVIQLWDANDLLKDTLDRACNTQMVFAIRNGRLNLTVFNRSNDFWFGYAGANIVHFTMIQEFVAIALDIPVGEYYTVSNNLHLYTELYDALPDMCAPPSSTEYDFYSMGYVHPYNLYSKENGSSDSFLNECSIFCEDPLNEKDYEYVHPFFKEVAFPMAMISFKRKSKISSGKEHLDDIKASDWKLAVQIYIDNREKKNVSK
jgi:thymidylate synthase